MGEGTYPARHANPDEPSLGGTSLVQWLKTWQFLLRHTFLLIWMVARLFFDYAVVIFRMRLLDHTYDPEVLDQIHHKNAKRYRETAFKLKGGTIKLGQYASARVDVMPRPWIEELSLLQDSVEPVDFDEIRATITRELGAPPEVIFEEIEAQATAAASFGQVHWARTKEGREVAVKIQHGHIEQTLSIDLAIMKGAVGIFGTLFPNLHVEAIYSEISIALRRELDYGSEGIHCTRIRKNLLVKSHVVVPEVFPKYCSGRVLVTEFIHGHKINDREKMKEHGLEAAPLLVLVLDAFIQQIYVDGFFQSDPHPGNLFFIPGETPEDVKIAIIDFGQVKEISQHFHRSLQRGVWAILMQDQALFLETLLEMGVIEPQDSEATAKLITEFAKHIETGAPEEVNNIQFEEVRETLEEFLGSIENLHIPDDLILYGRTIGLLHGLASDLDPSVDLFQIIRPYLMKFLLN